MMERSTARAAVLRCLIVFVAAAACGAAPLSSRAAAPAAAELFAFTPKSADDLRLIEQRVQDVVQRVMPATVGIVAPSGQGSGVIISEDGYILTAIDGEPLASRQRLNEELDQRGPSQQARLDLIRDGKLMTVTVKLATRGSQGGIHPSVLAGVIEDLKSGKQNLVEPSRLTSVAE